MRGIGVFLICYAVTIAMIGRAMRIPVAGVWFAIAMNAVWTVALLDMAVMDQQLTAIGRSWVVLQAAIVFSFAVAQLIGLRRAARISGAA